MNTWGLINKTVSSMAWDCMNVFIYKSYFDVELILSQQSWDLA